MAQSAAGIGNPLKLTLKQFAGIMKALADDSSRDSYASGDHRAKVDAQMRTMKNGRSSRQT